MANVSISSLPAAAALDGAEVVHGLQGGASRKVTTQGIADLAWRLSLVARPGAPTATASATAGNVNGSVYYAVTFVTADGETEAGSRVGPLAVSNKQVNLTNIPVSADPRVTARKIYRTPNGASDAVLGQLLATINDNTTTTYTDNTADASLGADAPWTNTTDGVFYDGAAKVGAMGEFAVALGQNAMPNVTGGYASTAIGGNALQSNTSGYRNTAVGYDALQFNTTGNANVGIGVHTGAGTTTGSGNISLGYGALQSNSDGDDNISIGMFAAQNPTAGDRCIYIGASAGQLRASGSDNIGIGYQSLRGGPTSTGQNNVAVGRGTGAAITTANFNNLVGGLAGNALTTGGTNQALGYSALLRCTTGLGNVAIGHLAGQWITTESNRLFISNQGYTDLADAQAKALLYGVFASTVASQSLNVGGLLKPNAGVAYPRAAVTGDTTLTVENHSVIVTGTATVTLTLPNAANYPGKIFHVVNRAAFAVVSNTSNVVPIAGGAAGTAICPATAGTWAILQSNGSTWDIIAS